MEILVVCGAGLGSSFACQMAVESVLQEMNVNAKVDHSDIASAAGSRADLIILASNFRNQIEKYNLSNKVMFLDRLIDQEEIKSKIVPILKDLGEL
ncbi:MAG: PTS sugar transporter subunit IIB [Tissierellia bacterium]|nr:PTS sugar transporter subunit IIB [Tissierellia bacterium]